jgi:hypothetical protein
MRNISKHFIIITSKLLGLIYYKEGQIFYSDESYYCIGLNEVLNLNSLKR